MTRCFISSSNFCVSAARASSPVVPITTDIRRISSRFAEATARVAQKGGGRGRVRLETKQALQVLSDRGGYEFRWKFSDQRFEFSSGDSDPSGQSSTGSKDIDDVPMFPDRFAKNDGLLVAPLFCTKMLNGAVDQLWRQL